MSVNSLSQQGRFVICLKGVPAVMQKQDIENICKKFGPIHHVNTNKRPLIFVNASDQSSYENIIKGLKENEFGIIAEPAKFMNNNSRAMYKPNRTASNPRTGTIPNNVARAQHNPDIATNTQVQDFQGICQVCQKPANQRCQRCGDFYCSKECQTNDYPQHRFICLAMPPLVEQNSRDIGLPIYQFQSAHHSMGEFQNKPLRKAASHNVLNKVKKNYRSQILPISQNPNNQTPSNTQQSGNNSKTNNQTPSNAQQSGNNSKTNNQTPSNTQQSGNNSKTNNQTPSNTQQSGYNSKTNNQTQPTMDKPKTVPKSIKNDMQPVRVEKLNTHEKKDNKYGPNVTKQDNSLNTETNKLDKTTKSSLESLIVKISKDVEKEKSTDTYPANGSTVCIQAALKSNRIWVRSLEKHLNDSFQELLQTISKCAQICDTTKVLPKVGDFVLADFKKGIFCRALVIHVYGDQEIVLRFVDFGIVGSRRLDQLKNFPNGLPKSQTYTHLVHLKNVPEFDLAPEQQDLIKKYSNSVTQFKISYDNATFLEVFLDDFSTNERLNTKLSEFASKRNSCTISETKSAVTQSETSLVDRSSSSSKNAGEVEKPAVVLNEKQKENTAERETVKVENKKDANDANTALKTDNTEDEKEITLQDIKNMTPSLDEEENVTVYVVDNSLLDSKMFCCVDLRFLRLVKQYEKEFGTYAKTESKPYKPRFFEICLAYCSLEDKWFRAECILENDNIPSLTFIDYGVTKDIPIANIRKYPRTLLRPCFMKTCFIENSTPLKPEIVAELKTLIPNNGKIIIDKRKKTSDEYYSVYIKDIDEKLKTF